MACVVGTVVGLLVRIWIVPRLRNKILEIKSNLTHTAIQITHQHLVDHHHHHQKNSNKENPVDVLKLTPIICDGDNNVRPCIAIINNNQKQSMDMELAAAKTPFDEHLIDVDDDKPEVAKIFTFLHILTACFSSFAHGANDTR